MAMNVKEPTIHLHRGDLPDGLDFGDAVAVDTETMGLEHARDRLCLVQLSSGDGVCHLVQFPKDDDYAAPNLRKLFEDEDVTKIFHYARFDVAKIRHHFGLEIRPVYCTKIASRLARTYTQSHGYKDVCRELVGVEISKEQQSSDWGADELTEQQLLYAATDVLHLNAVRDKLEVMLAREGRAHLAQACFDFLSARAELDLAGWDEMDIFAH